jgi:tripartite-type tricarboxylate transporter receptor subunit TctC
MRSALVWITAGLVSLGPGAAGAQRYPSQPVRVIASAPPGTPVDIRARWVAEQLSPALGQPVIVENKGGAGGNIGMQAAARSAPDGHTLAIAHQGTLAINPHVYARVGYDPLGDFAPVTRLFDATLLLAVNSAFPAQSVADLVRLAKEQPGRLSYGSAGAGTPPHLAGELFRKAAGIEVAHVPYKGSAAALTDLLGGRLAYMIEGAVIQGPQVRAGKLRALAVTSLERLAILPDVPTVSESGFPGFHYVAWMGVVAPAATPPAIIERLNAELVKALRTSEARQWFESQGAVAVGDTPEQFAAFIRAEHARWGAIVREAGIRAD